MSLSSVAAAARRAQSRSKAPGFKRAKKGDVVLVELKHTSAGNICARVKSTSYTDFQLAKVASTFTSGVIRSVVFDNGAEKHFDEFQRTYALGDKGPVCYTEFAGKVFQRLSQAQEELLAFLELKGLKS